MPEISVVEVSDARISVVEIIGADGIAVVEVTIPGAQGPQGPAGTGGGGGGSQTPWAQDIDAAGYNLSNLGYVMFGEISDPSAPSANQAILYFRDNGSGVTQACIRFANGNILVLGQDT